MYHLCVYGYVVMPKHVHLLLSEPERDTLAGALKSLKQGVARRLIAIGCDHFWQKRYYDFNVRNHRQFAEKLDYIHANPVKRGLCTDPSRWPWSSFIHYATGSEGIVEIESEWTANRRERAAGRLCPAIELPHPSQGRLRWDNRPYVEGRREGDWDVHVRREWSIRLLFLFHRGQNIRDDSLDTLLRRDMARPV